VVANGAKRAQPHPNESNSVEALNTDRQEDRGNSLRVDAARKRRLMDKSNRLAFEAEWSDLHRVCRQEVESFCRWLRYNQDDTAEIQKLVDQRLPRIVDAFDPDRASGAGFRTFLRKPIKFAVKDYVRNREGERTEVGVFSAREQIGDDDGSGMSEVRPPSREAVAATWDETTPASCLDQKEGTASLKSKVEEIVGSSKFSPRDKDFFRQVALESRSVEDVAREAKVEVRKVKEIVRRVGRSVAQNIPGRRCAVEGPPVTGAARADPMPAPPRPDFSATVGAKQRRVSSVTVAIASPQQILAQSSGEVSKPKTLHPRSLKPVEGGLMCERIFGVKEARRERMGHINLAAPVLNGWLFHANAPLVCRLLGMSRADVDALVYRRRRLVLDPGTTNLRRNQVLDDKEFESNRKAFGASSFKTMRGTEGLREALAHLNLGQCLAELQADTTKVKSLTKRQRLLEMAKALETLLDRDQRLEWIVMEVLPVLPAGLRPEIPIPQPYRHENEPGDPEGKPARFRFATSDLNRLYRKVLVENQRLKQLLEKRAPKALVEHRALGLQKSVDALLHVGRPELPGWQRRPLKALAESLEGKGGRFRGNLLGKRVDYSGRAVIVVGPELQLHQCGIPLKLGLKLFEPFLVRHLKVRGRAASTKAARRRLDLSPSAHWDDLEEVAQGKLVLLNRAPTLHRLSVQAFEPVFVSGAAIRLHPLACAAFGADFDGDQMAVHLPLSQRAQEEARELMMARSNFLSPANGQPAFAPSQEIVLGCFYLTLEPVQPPDPHRPPKAFGSQDEVLSAWDLGRIKTHDRICIPNPDQGFARAYGEGGPQIITTTVGRIVLNASLKVDLGFVNEPLDKRGLTKLITTSHGVLGADQTLALLDRIKEVGFAAATRAGISIGVADLVVPPSKDQRVQQTKSKEPAWSGFEESGAITEGERKRGLIGAWLQCSQQLKTAMMETLAPNHTQPEPNPLWLMLKSGARGSETQVAQLVAMRGIMMKMNGEFCERPITSNFREGLSPADYFVSAFGARKGMFDRSRATSHSGYLTRKLVHAVQDVLVSMEDCGTTEGKPLTAIRGRDKTLISLAHRLVGRVLAADVFNPKDPTVILVGANSLISPEKAAGIERAEVECVTVRSILTCQANVGVCARCYGTDPSTGYLVKVGTPVGVLAAQSIGEPGTQLTMRTFHYGGVATRANAENNDITQGLPRITELFEARKQKDPALLAPMGGVVAIEGGPEGARTIFIHCEQTGKRKKISVPKGRRIVVAEGQQVQRGYQLTEGQPLPDDLLDTRGLLGWQIAVIDEVLSVYAEQGAIIADQHPEVVVRGISRKWRIVNSGDSQLAVDDLVDPWIFADEIARLEGTGGRLPVVRPCPVGISKLPALAGSFLASAAFERTSTVLAKAAFAGKTATIRDMVGQVITGGLIPAGSGFSPEDVVADDSAGRSREAQRSPGARRSKEQTH
jgi:DNA-directed RNA polymerase subunit beta'